MLNSVLGEPVPAEISTEWLVEMTRGVLARARQTARKVPTAQLVQEAAAGAPLICVKVFKANGQRYQPGEAVEVDPNFGARLANAGYVTTATRWQEARQAKRIIDAYEEGRELEDRFVAAGTRARNAQLALAAAENELQAARARYDVAAAELGSVEGDLRPFLGEIQNMEL